MFTSHSQNLNFTGLIFFISFVQDASRNSVCHTATVIANSYMHCGTTSDTFLRYAINWISNIVNLFIPYFWFTDVLFVCLLACFFFFYQGSEWLIKSYFSSWTHRNNLEWLGRATNWAKFTATASLGVIHRVGKSVCMCLLYLFTLSMLLQTVTNYMYVHVKLKLSQAP